MKKHLGALLAGQRLLNDAERHPDRFGGADARIADIAAEWAKGEAEGLALLELHSLPLAEAFVRLNQQPPTPMAILWLIQESIRRGKSERSGEIASWKNAKARAFALAEWQKARAKEPKLSKRSFANRLLPVLEARPYLLTVLPETIAYEWLKGS